MQYLLQGKVLTDTDHEVLPEIEPLRLERRLERVATFRNMQATSAVSAQCNMHTFDDYRAEAHNIHLRPIQRGEFRHVRFIAGRRVAVICDSITGTELLQVLPDGLAIKVPQLVLGWDQCSGNTASDAFAAFKETFLFVHWDKLHRLMRDMNLAFKHCMNGRFMRAKT